jgi:hypothetical protein
MFSLAIVNQATALVLLGGEVEVQCSLHAPLLRTLRLTAGYAPAIPLWIDCAIRTQTRLPLHYLIGMSTRWEAAEIIILGMRRHGEEWVDHTWHGPLLTLTAQTISDPW